MSTAALNPPQSSGKGLRIAFWVAQVLLALVFAFIGFSKLTTPIPELATMMKWPGEYPPYFVRLIGAIDLLGGIGLLLPSATPTHSRNGPDATANRGRAFSPSGAPWGCLKTLSLNAFAFPSARCAIGNRVAPSPIKRRAPISW